MDETANRFVAPLSGAGEVPPVLTFAQGVLELKIDWEHQAVHYGLHVNGLGGITQAHIHLGSPNENGAPVALVYGPSAATGLVNGPLSQGMFIETDLLNAYAGDFAGFVQALRSGHLYINVHTADDPAGTIRGQIGSLTYGPRGKK
ncbi:CHRD domain-containing protein [Planctomycetota bacterium]